MIRRHNDIYVAACVQVSGGKPKISAGFGIIWNIKAL